MVGAGPQESTEAPGFGEHQGKIVNVLPNGSAFVESPAVEAAHGQQAYVRTTVVAKCELKSIPKPCRTQQFKAESMHDPHSLGNELIPSRMGSFSRE